MLLDGIHHITAITADARQNVDFYARLLGLRFVKKTVNHDAPEVYHLYYADELGTPGSVLTFFEFPGAPRGTAGAGMVYRIVWRVASTESLDFWAGRLGDAGVEVERTEDSLGFTDPEGLELELSAVSVPDEPLAAEHEEIPAEHALLGFEGVRVFTGNPEASAGMLEALGFQSGPQGAYLVKGDERHALYVYDELPDERPMQGAGSVHHIAWASQPEDHEAWRERVIEAGGSPTPIIDRIYFRSIYFREPSGVLFEIATLGPGFSVDEPLERLGERLVLPERYEGMRPDLERSLTPLENPRTEHAAG